MNWVLHVRDKARKAARRFPEKDQKHIIEALREMRENPFAGDIVKLDEENSWRRRVGAYRIFYEVFAAQHAIYVFRVERHTSKMY
ncbi:MAG: type II toxin-antitoxin system RelE/ParE family toxin [Candidatus Liptonbacteria bacterium]|nr:type II toxin-antitoxin system RelE/ParE family toxin [Candidatus Liptonbacteria bacterium]